MLKKTLLTTVLLTTALSSTANELVIASRDSNYGEAMQQIVNDYQAIHKDSKITLVQRPNGGLYESLVLSMREKTGNYDVIMMDDTWAPEFLSKQWLSPLSTSVEDQDFVKAPFDMGRYPDESGAAYAIPMVGNVAMFAWNKTIFDQYNLTEPKTWTDVLTSAKIINADKDISGLVFRGVKGNPIVTGFLPILWGFNANVIDDNGEAALNSPEALKALKTFTEMKQYAPKGVDVYNADEVRDVLQKGDAAMAIEVWPAWVPDLDNKNVSNVVGDMQIMTPPSEIGKSSPMLGIWQLAVPADAHNKKQAEEFIKFATNAKNQKKLALDYGIPPTRHSVYNDTAVVNKYRWYPQQAKALAAGKPRPRIQNWAEVESILGDFLQLAMMGEMTPEQALKNANNRIKRALKN